ncbi:hypothetical protein HII31_07042 [Pseudocercospora fuligena]|uniref:MARVEL domain-containing protein n=1 Tax=Pseudocercospora fuligena TaxID=685502 RepID=A0A8H6VLX5_9PEZI|nr:hypothetical protein HII31_07042 [Pseudocercospora fuligena]
MDHEIRTIGSLYSSNPLRSPKRSIEVTEENCMHGLQHYPQILITSAMVGGFGILDALLELTFHNVPFLALLVVDIMATTIYLSTGIIFAKTYAHRPKEFAHGLRACDLWSYCSRFQADIAFLFIGVIATATAGILVILYRRARAVEDIELVSPEGSVH